MPLASDFLSLFRSRGVQETLSLLGGPIRSVGKTLRQMGPETARFANDYDMVLDDAASGVGKYIGNVLPLERWEQIPVNKRKLAFGVLNKSVSPLERASAEADPEVSDVLGSLRKFYSMTNEENLAATDHLGNPLQAWNSLKGEYEPYVGMSGDYISRFVKKSKRDSILDPLTYTQSELERRMIRQRLTEKGLDPYSVLDKMESQGIQTDVGNAIDDYLRTGTSNSILNAPELLKVMKPAYDNFTQLADHMRKLRTGDPDIDSVAMLFGSRDPDMQRSGIRFLRQYLLRDANAARRFGSIESRRTLLLPNDWYEDDPLLIAPIYALRQQRRLAEIKRFGQNNETILGKDGLLSQIDDPQQREYVKSVFDRAMGLEPYAKSIRVNKWLDNLFATQVIKLGTAQVAQLGQLMNVAMETGLMPTVNAMMNLGQSKDIALKSGATLTRIMDIVHEGLAEPGNISPARQFTEGFLKWTGFNKADLFARHVGAGAGYVHGERIIHEVFHNPGDAKALRELRRLIPGASKDDSLFRPVLQKIDNIRSATGGRLVPGDVSKYFDPELLGIARNASLNANFRNSVLDIPLWASSPSGKLMTIFKSFAYKQTKFVVDRVKSDMAEGNPRSFLGLAAGAGLIGPAVSLLKSVPQGRLGEEVEDYKEAWDSLKEGDPKKAFAKALENITAVGALGMFDQVVRALRKGDTGWWEFIAGPLFTDLVRFAGYGGQAIAGATGLGNEELVSRGLGGLGQFAAGHVPIIGGGLSRGIRAATEPVTRHESGLVTRGQSQVLGEEEEPISVGGISLPPLPVLTGFEPSVYAQREKLMDEIKTAIEREDFEGVAKVLQKAQEKNIKISPQSLNRLIRSYRERQL